MVLREFPEVAAQILPEICPIKEQTLEILAKAPMDLALRLSLLFDATEPAKLALLRLRYDNETQEKVLSLVELQRGNLDFSEVGLRRMLRDYPAETIGRLLGALECKGKDVCTAKAALQTILARGDCTSLQALAITGKDLIALGIPAGKRMGELLEALLDRVIDGSLPNETGALLAAAKNMVG